MTPLYFLFSDSNKNNIYIKRDDLIPISFGGNKARKAMNFFKEIDQGGFDCVVTYGSGSFKYGSFKEIALLYCRSKRIFFAYIQ